VHPGRLRNRCRSFPQAIAQYIASPPLSLAKIPFQNPHGKIAFHTQYNPYFKEHLKLFPPLDFIAEFTQHILPSWMQSHNRRLWYLLFPRLRTVEPKPYILALAPEGGTQTDIDPSASQKPPQTDLGSVESTSAWARLIAKVYEIDLLGGCWLRSNQPESSHLCLLRFRCASLQS
jgi:hypothetical protein